MKQSGNAVSKAIEEIGGDLFSDLQRDVPGFQRLTDLLKNLTGIHLPPTEKNLTLLASRLAGMLAAKRLHTYDQYLDYLNNCDDDGVQQFVSSLTTNTTSFFREEKHFQLVREILEKLSPQRRRGSDEIRIWCSACSTGQEAYSLAIVAEEALRLGGVEHVKVLATDIDTTALDHAYHGVYTPHEMEGLQPLYLQKYFVPSNGGFRPTSQLRRHLEFAEFNLSAASYPFDKSFDIVFCRNVLIYFDRPTIDQVLKNLIQSLNPGGHLFLGHSESGLVRTPLMKSIAVSAFVKVQKIKGKSTEKKDAA